MANENLFVDEGSSALSGAFSGALAGGSVGGAPGAVIGGAIGAGIAIFSADKQNDATRTALKRKEEALKRAQLLKKFARDQASQTRTAGKNLSAAKPTSNGQANALAPSSAISSGISSSGTF